MSMKRSFNNVTWNHPEHTIDSYDYLRYFTELNNQFPNTTILTNNTYKDSFLSYDLFIEKIQESKNTELLIKSNTINGNIRKISYRIGNNIFIIENVFPKNEEDFDLTKEDFHKIKEKEQTINKQNTINIISSLTIMHTEENLSDTIVDMLDGCLLKELSVPKIGIISRDNMGFFLNQMKYQGKSCGDLDLHYPKDKNGNSFSDFHRELLNRLVNEKSGLVLLHGEPGTGKSSYIRQIITDLEGKSKKKVVFVPSNLVEHIADPDFISFLIEQMDTSYYDEESDIQASENVGMVLILEEAQNALSKREDNFSKQSTNNILNLTEGILNDLFNIQIIATYNTKDSNIDPAIKRDMRLIADKYFGFLDIEKSNELAKSLNISDLITEPMPVSKIYSLLNKKTNNILIDRGDEKSSMGLI